LINSGKKKKRKSDKAEFTFPKINERTSVHLLTIG